MLLLLLLLWCLLSMLVLYIVRRCRAFGQSKVVHSGGESSGGYKQGAIFPKKKTKKQKNKNGL